MIKQFTLALLVTSSLFAAAPAFAGETPMGTTASNALAHNGAAAVRLERAFEIADHG